MAAINPTDWASFYKSNRNDGGVIQNLFAYEDDELADISKNHLGDPASLTTTIAGSGEANLLLVPSATRKKDVEVIHQGFASSLQLGGDVFLAFVHGNLSGSAFKVLNPTAAVEGIGVTRVATRNATTGILSPKPESYFGVNNEDEFSSLLADGSTALQDRPNHIFLHPKHFIMMNGPKSKRAKSFAITVIRELNDRNDEDMGDDQARKAVEREKVEVGALLAFLWAAENDLLTGVDLTDPPENVQFNSRCELIRAKIRKERPTRPGTGGTPTLGPSEADATSLAVAAQTLTTVMAANEKTRVEEREEDRSSKSLIRNLGPKQQGLFLRLATEHMAVEPEMSEFMKGVIKEKSPVKATQLILAEMRRWKGIVSLASLHRFLSNGFLSQETNLSEPGGLTGFMFFPRSEMAAGASGAGRDKQRIRDYFDLPIEDECINYYIKKEYFVPRNTYQLEIVLAAWKDLIELCTVKGSIATAGLRHFLRNYEDIYQILDEMFRVVPNFGLLLILSLDRHLQNFYDMVSDMPTVSAASPYDRGYLHRRADVLIQELEEHKPPSIIIPACLLTHSAVSRGALKNGGENERGATPLPKEEKALSKAPKEPQTPEKNEDVEPKWTVPSGKFYNEFFPRNSPNLSGWPKLQDPRFDSDRSMCVKYQVLGRCKSRCPLAHMEKGKMANKDEVEISTRFRKLYSGL
jgi:hypothetical protein